MPVIMEDMVDCSVLIAGAGLSGLSAAYHLTRLGVKDIVVVERMPDERYGRYHRTCGEAVSDRMLTMAGVPISCIVRDIDAIRITCGEAVMDIPVKGHIVDRVKLLEDMRKGTVAKFVRGSVRGIRKADGGYIVSCGDSEYHCRYLIGADGVFSTVRKELFGYSPKVRFAAVNNIIKGESGTSVLNFEASAKYPGSYRWDFPAKDGFRSVGYEVGADELTGYHERGIRFIGVGRNGPVVKDSCCLVGDAGVLTNPICYGGIGAALISGRRAAECIAEGDLEKYQRWVERDRMFDPHFMKALDTFRGWTAEDYADSVRPFRKGYSLARGAFAILRRPKWANVYMSVYVAFNKGW